MLYTAAPIYIYFIIIIYVKIFDVLVFFITFITLVLIIS